MKIAEVSEKYGLSPDTLRYYERVGLLPSVTRTESGIREFSEVDIKRVEFIKCMRNAGLPVEVLTEYIAMVQEGDSTIPARKAILTEQREILQEKMLEMQQTLDLLNYKIDIYETKLLDLERGISQSEETVQEVV
jgi:DNA-binding transcriptional MerR regulator